jgi:hypothetical protein
LLLSLACIAPATAQSSRSAAIPSVAQSERNAVDLKQGMTLEEVQKLLGKPRRTALRSEGNASNPPAQGNLQWTYVWTGASSQASTLNVQFAAKKPEEWYVSSWDWTTY